VLVVNGLPTGSLGLKCHIAAEVVGEFHRLVVEGIEDVGFGYVVEVDGHCTCGVAVPAGLLPLLQLAKDLNAILELCEPCSLSIYMLPSGFGALSCGLSASDGFLFLIKPFYLLLNPSLLCFYCSFIFPIFILNLFELCISLDEA
jgi:hypothetical protein